MPVGEFCTRDVVIAEREADLVEIAQLMRQYHVGSVVIVEARNDKNFPLGIVTDRDLVIEVLSQDLPLNAVSVSDIMSNFLLCVREQDGLWETIRLLRKKGVRRAPVLKEDGSLAGLLAVDDVLELLSEELSHLSSIMTRELQQERVARP